MKIEAHQLVGSCVEYLRCTKCSRLLETIDTVVLHSTDLANAPRRSSAHSPGSPLGQGGPSAGRRDDEGRIQWRSIKSRAALRK